MLLAVLVKVNLSESEAGSLFLKLSWANKIFCSRIKSANLRTVFKERIRRGAGSTEVHNQQSFILENLKFIYNSLMLPPNLGGIRKDCWYNVQVLLSSLSLCYHFCLHHVITVIIFVIIVIVLLSFLPLCYHLVSIVILLLSLVITVIIFIIIVIVFSYQCYLYGIICVIIVIIVSALPSFCHHFDIICHRFITTLSSLASSFIPCPHFVFFHRKW